MSQSKKIVEEFAGDKTTVEKHESFGMLRISRVSGGRSNLFGSSIQHREKITLEIGRGEKHRHLNNNWYSMKDSIVEVEMSPTQFAEAITSLNCGSGIPVTILSVERKMMDECPEVNQRQVFEDEFNDQVKDISGHMIKTEKEINDIVTKPKVGKSDLKRIQELVARLHMEIRSNIPYIQTQFNEAMDKTVLEAKGEVEATILHAVTAAGLDAIANGHAKGIITKHFPMLQDGNDE